MFTPLIPAWLPRDSAILFLIVLVIAVVVRVVRK